nr:MAG TPA: hypothetical protein [Caudoviricetes sp.]
MFIVLSVTIHAREVGLITRLFLLKKKFDNSEVVACVLPGNMLYLSCK